MRNRNKKKSNKVNDKTVDVGKSPPRPLSINQPRDRKAPSGKGGVAGAGALRPPRMSEGGEYSSVRERIAGWCDGLVEQEYDYESDGGLAEEASSGWSSRTKADKKEEAKKNRNAPPPPTESGTSDYEESEESVADENTADSRRGKQWKGRTKETRRTRGTSGDHPAKVPVKKGRRSVSGWSSPAKTDDTSPWGEDDIEEEKGDGMPEYLREECEPLPRTSVADLWGHMFLSLELIEDICVGKQRICKRMRGNMRNRVIFAREVTKMLIKKVDHSEEIDQLTRRNKELVSQNEELKGKVAELEEKMEKEILVREPPPLVGSAEGPPPMEIEDIIASNENATTQINIERGKLLLEREQVMKANIEKCSKLADALLQIRSEFCSGLEQCRANGEQLREIMETNRLQVGKRSNSK